MNYPRQRHKYKVGEKFFKCLPSLSLKASHVECKMQKNVKHKSEIQNEVFFVSVVCYVLMQNVFYKQHYTF